MYNFLFIQFKIVRKKKNFSYPLIQLCHALKFLYQDYHLILSIHLSAVSRGQKLGLPSRWFVMPWSILIILVEEQFDDIPYFMHENESSVNTVNNMILKEYCVHFSNSTHVLFEYLLQKQSSYSFYS